MFYKQLFHLPGLQLPRLWRRCSGLALPTSASGADSTVICSGTIVWGEKNRVKKKEKRPRLRMPVISSAKVLISGGRPEVDARNARGKERGGAEGKGQTERSHGFLHVIVADRWREVSIPAV